MKKVLFISTIVLFSACKGRGPENPAPTGDSTKTQTVTKDSSHATMPVITDSPPKAAIAKLKWDTSELRKNCKKLEQENAKLVKDTARLGLSNRQLLSENKRLAAEKPKTPAKTAGDDCASIRKENTSLKKSVQTLTIKNAALEGENNKLTKQLTPKQQDDTKLTTRDSKKRGNTKKDVREEYKSIFDAVNGRKN